MWGSSHLKNNFTKTDTFTYLGLLTVGRFFLPEDLRRGRIGSRILAMAEQEARARGCTRAVLSTLHFQAPGFYLKQGWEVAARIDCEPPGHTRFYMTKKLSWFILA